MSKRAIVIGIMATIALAMWAKKPSHKINTSDNSTRPAPVQATSKKLVVLPASGTSATSVFTKFVNKISNAAAAPEEEIQAPAAEVSKEEKEIAALESMSEILAAYSQNTFLGAKQLKMQLEKAKLDPVVADWSNDDTGKMEIVRTNETMPGTRYFHAQFFENADGTPLLQHMSFEFRPSPDAMDLAIKFVEQKYGRDLSHRVQNDQDYVLWKTGNGRIVYVQKMALKDLKDNPFNAYTKDDVGTIKVAVELDIHDAGHNHEH